MKCFEMNKQRNRTRSLEKLTVNMKCFEIATVAGNNVDIE